MPEIALPEPARIVLLTMEAGDDPVSRTGHGALCVEYVDETVDSKCYNYGTTDVSNETALTLSYFRGAAVFWLSTPSYAATVSYYGPVQDRTVWRQEIPFSLDERRELADRLAADEAPDKKYYRYHHFHDNCTSRLRDHLDAVSGGQLRSHSDSAVDFSWRGVARDALRGMAPLQFAAEFAGRGADEHPSLWDAMVIPAVLRDEVSRRLDAPPVKVYARRGTPIPLGSRMAGPMLVVALGGLIAGLTQLPKHGLGLVGAVLGFGGLLLELAAVASPLAEVRYNEDLLVFLPTDLLLGRMAEQTLRVYAGVRLLGLVAVLGLRAGGLFVQPGWTVLAVIGVFAAIAVPRFWRRAG